MTLSNGGLTVTPTGLAARWGTIRTQISKTSGRCMLSFSTSIDVTANSCIWVWLTRDLLSTLIWEIVNYSVWLASWAHIHIARIFWSNNFYGSPSPQLMTCWRWRLILLLGMCGLLINNVWANSSNPATGSLPIVSFIPATVGALFPAMAFSTSRHRRSGPSNPPPPARNTRRRLGSQRGTARPRPTARKPSPISPAPWAATRAATARTTLRWLVSDGGLT